MKKLLILALLLTSCASNKPTVYDLEQNAVINALVEGHNKLVAQVHGTPVTEVKK